MDFGPHTIHIFVSLIVVLAAAGVALVCDLLKGNNEHLRELAVELKVRHEEAERRILVMEKKGKRIPDLSSAKPVIAAAAVPSGSRIESSPANIESPFTRPEPVPASLPKVAAAPEPLRQARPERRRREMSPAVAAIAQAAAAIVNNNKEHHQEAVAAGVSRSFDGPAQQQMTADTDASANGARKNWDSILKKTMSRQAAVIPFESIREAVPAGFHEASVLQRAVETGRTVSGLIVSIGTNALGGNGSNEVGEFLQGLLTAQDFACQSGADEYVIVCTGDQGAAAQRRLSAISEKLWDFQLRSIGGLGVQFSWGSAEARGERVGEVVATAIEQMQETRQSRRVNIAKAV
jgi:hypothetical protein